MCRGPLQQAKFNCSFHVSSTVLVSSISVIYFTTKFQSLITELYAAKTQLEPMLLISELDDWGTIDINSNLKLNIYRVMSDQQFLGGLLFY